MIRKEPTKLYLLGKKSSVGTTDINNGFQPGDKKTVIPKVTFIKWPFKMKIILQVLGIEKINPKNPIHPKPIIIKSKLSVRKKTIP